MPKLLMTLDTHGSKASALRKTLETSEQLEKELSQVLKSYSQHLDELAESVETVAIRAQVRLRPVRHAIETAVSVSRTHVFITDLCPESNQDTSQHCFKSALFKMSQRSLICGCLQDRAG